MPQYKLSICIPTYNRELFLKDTLDSILCQLDDEIKEHVEICISDNASNDNTKYLVENYQKKYRNITYFCFDINMGADSNFLQVVNIASGKYCWLLGSDDIILNNGIRTVLNEIQNNYDILSLTCILYDISLKNSIMNKKIKEDVVYNDRLQCIKELGTSFGYLSSIVVRKQMWDKFAVERKYIGSAFCHVYIMLSILKEQCILKFIAEPCIGFRLGNDSFLSEGRYNRLKLDVIAFNDIPAAIFGKNSKEFIYINRVMVRDHIPNHILLALLNKGANMRYRITVFKLSFKYYKTYMLFWLKTIPLLLTPSFVMLGLRVIYRKTLKKRKLIKNINQEKTQ